jgi:hypothetical protein
MVLFQKIRIFEILINTIHEVNDLGYLFSKKISKVIVQELLMSNEISPNFKETKQTDKETETLLNRCKSEKTKEKTSAGPAL